MYYINKAEALRGLPTNCAVQEVTFIKYLKKTALTYICCGEYPKL